MGYIVKNKKVVATIGESVKDLRESLHLTQNDFAKLLDDRNPPSKGSVSGWEHGKSKPPMKYLKKMQELGMDTDIVDPVTPLRIKLIRSNLNLDLAEFASLINQHCLGKCNAANVSLWENGSNLPTTDRLEFIAKLGKTTVAELLGTSHLKKLELADTSLLYYKGKPLNYEQTRGLDLLIKSWGME